MMLMTISMFDVTFFVMWEFPPIFGNSHVMSFAGDVLGPVLEDLQRLPPRLQHVTRIA